MKYAIIMAFLLFMACKEQSIKGSDIDPSVYHMWQDYLKANPKDKASDMPESWYFHNNKKDANHLAALTRKGIKKAGSGLYAWYEEANADLPKNGTKHIITDFDGKAQAIIEIIKVDTIPFNRISKAYAEMDMGTEMDALEKWKKAHWEFFSNSTLESGKKPSEEMLIVCETFMTIWPNELN